MARPKLYDNTPCAGEWESLPKVFTPIVKYADEVVGPVKRSTALYRFFDSDGDLLYVGITYNPNGRIAGHSGDKPWFQEIASATFEHFPNRRQALDAETFAIAEEGPLYNIKRPRNYVDLDTAPTVLRYLETTPKEDVFSDLGMPASKRLIPPIWALRKHPQLLEDPDFVWIASRWASDVLQEFSLGIIESPDGKTIAIGGDILQLVTRDELADSHAAKQRREARGVAS